MKIYALIDFLQRKINSLLFRGVFLLYSVLLLSLFYNEWNSFVYIIITIIYILIFFKLQQHSKLRLLNDFVFLNLIILHKDPYNPLIFVYILLPIVNSINFSGNKKSILLYFFTILTFVFQLYYFNNSNLNIFSTEIFLPLLAILFLWFINIYTNLRIKIRNFREELNSEVDNFYLNKEEIKRPHKIYNNIINVIHEHTNKIEIEDIICFTIKPEKKESLVVVNGSSFIWNYKIDEEESIISEIRERKNLLNKKINLEGKIKLKNLLLYSEVQGQEYIYAFIIKKNLPIYYVIIGFFRTLIPAFKKISNVLLSEKRLQDVRNEETSKLSDKIQYVTLASKTMHFIRNRLGPFSNLISMLDEFETISENKIADFKKLINEENNRAKYELNNITKRADKILEKSTNPFIFTTLSELSIEKVYTIFKRNIDVFFPNSKIKLSYKSKKDKEYVLLNEEGFELFLSDWLKNMDKYKKSFVKFNFFVTKKTVEISFINNHNLKLIELNELISDLTTDDKNKIIERTTHGIYTIKSTLTEMKIPFEAFSLEADDSLVLKIILKKINYENSRI